MRGHVGSSASLFAPSGRLRLSRLPGRNCQTSVWRRSAGCSGTRGPRRLCSAAAARPHAEDALHLPCHQRLQRSANAQHGRVPPASILVWQHGRSRSDCGRGSVIFGALRRMRAQYWACETCSRMRAHTHTHIEDPSRHGVQYAPYAVASMAHLRTQVPELWSVSGEGRSRGTCGTTSGRWRESLSRSGACRVWSLSHIARFRFGSGATSLCCNVGVSVLVTTHARWASPRSVAHQLARRTILEDHGVGRAYAVIQSDKRGRQ